MANLDKSDPEISALLDKLSARAQDIVNTMPTNLNDDDVVPIEIQKKHKAILHEMLQMVDDA